MGSIEKNATVGTKAGKGLEEEKKSNSSNTNNNSSSSSAVVILKELPPPLVATHDMSFYCFYVLKKHFKRHKGDLLNGISKTTKKRKTRPHSYTIPEAECALFVGWKIDSDNGERLRGCKGTHAVLPLEEGLRHYALISAFDDRRFSMMREEEVPTLSCSISLLHQFEDAENINDWEIGTHGLKIEFEDSRSKFRSATFLPSVMTQFGYTKRQTIKRLIEKSGSKDKLTKSLAGKIRTTRFQASEIKTHHSEWENKLSLMNKRAK